MSPESLKIQIGVAATAPSLARAFVTTLMEHVGVEIDQIENVRIVVSDLVTALLTKTEAPISLSAEIEDEWLILSGTGPGQMPDTGPLLGGNLTMDSGKWQIRLALD